VKDSKGTTSLAHKYSFLANMLQTATSTGAVHCPVLITRKQCNYSYISELTDADLEVENGIKFRK